MRNYYVPGSWNAICDRCGFKFKSHMLLKEWTGLQVCHECFEFRHPQDLIKLQPERIGVDWARPEASDIFIAVGELLFTESGIPILLEAGGGLQGDTI